MMNNNKDEQILCNRFKDLANNAYHRGICTFTDFLNLNEQGLFLRIKNELPMIQYFTFGGYSEAERKMLCFCGDDTIKQQQSIDFPFTCIKIYPQNEKFSDDLSHRDFLGATIHLGIDRSKLGDILINEKEGYLFCSNTIREFLLDNLIKVKHTNVSTSMIELSSFDYKPKFQAINGTVSSIRLDSVLSVAFHTSRSSLTGLIEGGKVFVNSKVILSNSYILKENDIISVRGFGRFIYLGTSKITKKGKYSITLSLYV